MTCDNNKNDASPLAITSSGFEQKQSWCEVVTVALLVEAHDDDGNHEEQVAPKLATRCFTMRCNGWRKQDATLLSFFFTRAAS